ncbi:F-box only protein 15 isoform X2 [Epinephelus moara]|uniref:F-box only protein 15 isoform X2 n=1 Tax=Epinephelus moara TaxID=300413 RepID=UPI00214EB691|nr:F-box only protein 15 isoform X2 [Epinephelus moara]
MSAPKAVSSRVRAVRTTKRADKSSLNFVERLPSHILIKILSYLDASALHTVSHVNKLFYQLANDHALWKKIHMAEFGKRRKWKSKCTDELLLKMATVEVQDRAAGYWKWLHFRTVAACDMDKWKRHLGLISRHTGLPGQTERVLRNLHVTWELTVSDKSGREVTFEPSWSHFCETSVTVCWSGGGCLPSYQQISTLQLHGVRRIDLDCPGLKNPYVEPMDKPPLDDIDPEYGLHGYQLHIVLHDAVCEIMSGSFSQLFCRRTHIHDGLIQLTAISGTSLSQHTPLSGNIKLSWRCEALQGAVENCCIMSLTLLDEFKKPFWCVGSPVSMEPEERPVSYDYDGEHFLIHYQDSDGQVKMKLVWMKEQKQCVLISLVVCLTVGKVNKHFGRDY